MSFEVHAHRGSNSREAFTRQRGVEPSYVVYMDRFSWVASENRKMHGSNLHEDRIP